MRERLKGERRSACDAGASALVGELLAERAKAISLEEVHFERGRRRYQGKLKVLVEALRAHGLQVK